MDYKKIYKKIEIRYIIVAITLILVFATRQIIIQNQINLAKDMSRVINIAGRQRMLSQKITKNALMVYENRGIDIENLYLQDLELSLDTFDRSHHNLKNGKIEEDAEMQNSPVIIGLFDKIDPYFYSILDSANRIIELANNGENTSREILANIELIALNEQFFLEIMDEIVFQYDNETESIVLQIERLELIAFYLILFAVLFTTIFVFIPATKTLRYAFIDISETNENIIKLFRSMKGALFLVDEEGNIMNNNSGAVDIVSVNESEIKNSNIGRVVKWFDISIINIIKDVISGAECDGLEVKIEDKNEKVLTLLISATKGRYRRKQVVLITAYDITAQKKAEEILKNMAIKDELTELYNRHFLESIIKAEIERSKRYEFPISAAILDIDNFKKINDKWGHPVGDTILKETAKILRENSRESDYEVRIGGEEFVILMPHTNLEGAYSVAEKLRKAIEENTHPIVGRYTASFGVAERAMDESYFELYNRMDNALYKAKKSGKNCVVKSTLNNKQKIESSLEWTDKWNSGEETIDAQHRELIDLIDKIIDGSISLEDNDSLEYNLNLLMNHLQEHFIYEEKVLAEEDYIYLVEHQKIHASLLEKSYRLKEQAIKGQISIEDLLEFMLHDVIIGHILKEDTKFFELFQKKS